MIHQLLYRSRANVEVSPVILACIVDIAEVRNAKLGITGLLLHQDGMFVQLIEGPRDFVDLLMEKISGDSRHCNIEILKRRDLPEREFGDWAMAIVCDDDAECSALTERCCDAPVSGPIIARPVSARLPNEIRTRAD